MSVKKAALAILVLVVCVVGIALSAVLGRE